MGHVAGASEEDGASDAVEDRLLSHRAGGVGIQCFKLAGSIIRRIQESEIVCVTNRVARVAALLVQLLASRCLWKPVDRTCQPNRYHQSTC
jgi:hypothetical protein